MNILINKWHSFWLKQVPPHALALTRIGFGLFMLFYTATYAGSLTTLFSNKGVAISLYNNPPYEWMLAILQAPSVIVVYIVYSILVLALIGFITGAYYRISTIFCITILLYFWQLQLHLLTNSSMRLQLLIFIVLLFSNAHYTYSADARRWWGSSTAWQPITILPQRIICIQLSVTYFSVGWQKFFLPDWRSGEILTHSFIGRWATPIAFYLAKLPIPLAVWDIVNIIVKYWELIMPFGLWNKHTKLFCIITGTLFHLYIASTLAMWWFLFIPTLYHLYYAPISTYEWLKQHKFAT
jgi:hypothetical protein